MKVRITLDELKQEFFKEEDTVTIPARELQKFIIDKDNQITKLRSKVNDLMISNSILKNKIERLETEEKSSFFLDLKA